MRPGSVCRPCRGTGKKTIMNEKKEPFHNGLPLCLKCNEYACQCPVNVPAVAYSLGIYGDSIPEWQQKLSDLWQPDVYGEKYKRVKDFIRHLLAQKTEAVEKLLEAMKRKCDGENGCGYDGTQEDRQYVCGSGVVMNGPQLHEIIKIRNQVIQEILNKL